MINIAASADAFVRIEDLEALDALLAKHKVTMLTGEIGVGKRLLLRSLENRWVGPTLRIPYHHTETPYRGSGLEIVFAGLQTVTGGKLGCDLGDRSTTDRELASTVLKALNCAEIPEGTLIIIPGVDEMDHSSQAVLGHVLRRLSDPRVRIVLSARQVTDESPLAGIPHLHLRTRGHAELTALAQHLTGGRVCKASARIAVRTAAGRAHALGMVLQQMSESQQVGHFGISVPVRIGPNAASMAHEIVGDLNNDLTRTLKLLALAPLTCSRALHELVPELFMHLSDLESRGLVERRGRSVLITDEFVRAAVHGSMSSGERLSLHQQLAAACAQSDAPLKDWHDSFAAGNDGAASRLAADALAFITDGLVDAGIEFIERALSISPDAAQLASGLVDAAEALLERGESAFASRYLRFAQDSKDPCVAVRARAIGFRSDYLQTQTLPSRLINHWSRSELSAAPRQVAHLQLTLGLLHCDHRELADAAELLETAERMEEHFGPEERRLRDALRMSVDAAHGDDQLALASLAELGALEPTELTAESLLATASALMLTEHYQSAQACLELLRHICSEATIWRTQARYLEAEIAIRSGQIGQALGLIQCFTEEASVDPSIRQDRLLLLQCWHLLTSGRASDAEAKESELASYATRTRNRTLLAALNALQGNYLLRVGLPAAAARHLQRCDEHTNGELNPNQYRHEPDFIEALIRLGRREHAALLLKRLRSRTERAPSRWAEGAVRRCEALLAPGQQSVDLLQSALRAQPDSVLAQALLHSALAERLADLGAASRSREQAQLAASLMEEIGARPAAERDAVPFPESVETPEFTRPELNGLSDDERVVVEMVRAGLKNREIASRIYVSLRTVELRLTAVYRKLGVTSRTELVARLAGAPPMATT